jgi:hypothetical protein
MKASTPVHVKSLIAAPSLWCSVAAICDRRWLCAAVTIIRHRRSQSAATILAIALCALLGTARAETGLAKAFVTPPDEAKPWVNMFWIGRITPADITQHLEELKAKGAGGANLIDLNAMPDAPYMSDNWRKAFQHALREADRLGLKIGVNTCPGWPSGGPWITPENGAWMMVNSATVIKGPQKYAGKLVEPKCKGALYAEVAVQAFRIPGRTANPPPVVTASSNPDDLPNLLDGNFNTLWKPAAADGKPWLLIDFGQAHGVDWLWMDMVGQVNIEASDDGVAFKPVSTVVGAGQNTIYRAVPAITARWFRLGVGKEATVHDFALGSKLEVERVARMAAKRGITNPLGVSAIRQIDQVDFVREDLVALPDDHPLALRDRIDLTSKVAEDGTLTWDVPDGSWKVLRIGRMTTGMKLAFGNGLVTDYLSPVAMEQHYEKGIKPLLSDAGALVGKTWQYSIEDNFEADLMYSWSPKLLEEFKTRRGYDPAPYLAALAGEIVDNVGITDRFLADVRRTIADCTADQHYGRWAELAHADGLKVRAEAGGQHHPRLYLNDGLMNQGRMDVPVAEFWEIELWKENQGTSADHHAVTTPGWMDAAQNVNAKQAASAGHLYGKPMVASEAFTSGGRRARWGTAPADLLMHANTAFCEGINALCIHGSATSGPENGLPGKSVFGGIHFSHNQTWWNQGAEGLLSYLSRCCYILRQGLFVADVLYYSGDEVPNFVPPKNIDPSRGFGYDYDVCNSEVLLTRLAVKDGRIVLPDGMSYRVLVLPNRPVMPLPVVRKIEEMVAAGATVIGPKPQRTPGLTDYPGGEQQLNAIADKMWGTGATAPVLQIAYGKGRVISGVSVRDVLAKMAVPVDFAYTGKTEDALLDFIHRRSGDVEIYFVANRHATALHAECSFRVGGKQPELWDPVTGMQRHLSQFAVKDGRTSIPLQFEPYGGLFVVFQKPLDCGGSPPLSAQAKSKESTSGTPSNFPTLQPIQEIPGPWTVQFDPKWFYPIDNLTGDAAKGLLAFDKLEDWRTRREPAAQNFSGTAVYRKTFTLADLSKSQNPKSAIFLDLGTVKETAKVKLNGKDLGVVWCSPWRVEITGTVKAGENELEISVVNLWPNRLTGDNNLPDGQRRTRTEMFMGGPDYPFSSGLLGSVTIQTVQP